MERHFCKLCFRTFPNGRSLGGHMRSHLLPLSVPVREELQAYRTEERRHESAASSATSEEKTELVRGVEGEVEGGVGMRFQNYGLRENPRRSIRVAGPVFDEEDYEDGSVSLLLQDRESETESSRNLTRRRSKRVRKSFLPQEQKLRSPPRNENLSRVKVGDSSEPASSISEETSEEDVAFCLMLLSRDRWQNKTEIIKNRLDDYGDEDEEEEEDDGTEKVKSFDDTSESEDGAEVKSESRKRANRDRGKKYRCKTCTKLFRSYQAFGGHRASHKKARLSIPTAQVQRVAQKVEETKNDAGGGCNNKVHECPFCDRVFASGQALGGHKRSHARKSNYYAATSGTTKIEARSCPIPARVMIDLNMPAPADDELSRVEFGGRVKGVTGIIGQN